MRVATDEANTEPEAVATGSGALKALISQQQPGRYRFRFCMLRPTMAYFGRDHLPRTTAKHANTAYLRPQISRAN